MCNCRDSMHKYVGYIYTTKFADDQIAEYENDLSYLYAIQKFKSTSI